MCARGCIIEKLRQARNAIYREGGYRTSEVIYATDVAITTISCSHHPQDVHEVNAGAFVDRQIPVFSPEVTG
jgi:hypothetical protein